MWLSEICLWSSAGDLSAERIEQQVACGEDTADIGYLKSLAPQSQLAYDGVGGDAEFAPGITNNLTRHFVSALRSFDNMLAETRYPVIRHARRGDGDKQIVCRRYVEVRAGRRAQHCFRAASIRPARHRLQSPARNP